MNIQADFDRFEQIKGISGIQELKGFRSYFKGVLGAPCASCGSFLKSLTTQKVFATHNVAPESLP